MIGLDAEGRKGIVSDFLARCIDYADSSIARKRGRGDDAEEIERWVSYREFTAIAIAEIEGGELDDWFEEGLHPEQDPMGAAVAEPPPSPRITELASLDHEARAAILAAAISPNPLLIASTRSASGVENAAAVSAVSVVSNTPPLLSLSLSKDREGRRRDTLVNLGTDPSITLISLRAEHDACRMLEVAASDQPRDVSEWESMPMEIPERDGKPSPDLGLAFIECTCLEIRELPEGASAELAILRVDSIAMASDDGVPLAQHGLDLVGPARTARGWKRRLRR